MWMLLETGYAVTQILRKIWEVSNGGKRNYVNNRHTFEPIRERDYRKIRFYVKYHSGSQHAHRRSGGTWGIIPPTKLRGGNNGSIRRQRYIGNPH